MSDSNASPPAPGAASGVPVWKNPFLIAFVVGAVTLTLLPFLQRTQLRAPEPIAHLGDWKLVDEQGQAFGSDELKGKVWIASFFFTRCPSVCPKQQESLGKVLAHVDDLQGKAGVAPIELVSFTVDPEHDTPATLVAYRQKQGGTNTDPRWHFLTGEQDALRELLVKRFMVAMGDKRAIDGSADLFDISHVSKFALVDQEGAVRGYWNTDDEGRGNVINAARLLAKRGPRP